MAATAFAPARALHAPTGATGFTTGGKETGRNGSVDYLRLVGSLAIIWFHLDLPGASVALAALPMFVALFVCFGVGRDISMLNKRLLYPWLMWSAIFAAAKCAQALLSGVPIASEFEWWMLLAGPSIHLWFLPFSFMFVVLVTQMRRQTRGALVVILVPCSIWLSNIDLPQPFAQWVTVIPAACLGMVLNYLGPRNWRAHVLGWGSVAIAGLMVVAGAEVVALQYVVGISAVLLALTVSIPATAFSRISAEISFGIYLLHPLVMALVLYLPFEDVFAQGAVVILTSVFMTMMIRRVTPVLV